MNEMTVQERILTLRVLEDVKLDSDYAKRLGLSVKMKKTIKEDCNHEYNAAKRRIS